jgi:hypothetical protein
MRETPVHATPVHTVPEAIPRVAFALSRRPLGLVAGACAAVAGLGLAPVCEAQMFIRVPAPSVQQQDQSTVNAMPNAPGATDVSGAPQEAVLSSSGGVVKMVDQNGNEIGYKGWSLFHGWRPTFYLDIGVSFDDNIFITPHKTGDVITKIQPGIVLGWGDYRAQLPRLGAFAHQYELPNDELLATKYFYVDYHPTFQIFASTTKEDVVNESVLATGSYNWSKLTVSGQLQYQTLSDVNVDVGGRINWTQYSGNVTGTYIIDDKTSLEETLSSLAVDYTGNYQNSVDSRSTSYLNYQVAPKTNVSAGIVIGYLAPQLSPDEYYQQLIGRVRWSGSDKLYLYADGGVEVREGTDGTDTVDGVFDFALNYAPFDGTRFLFSGTRVTTGTADNLAEDVTVTQVQLGVQQRLFGRVYANSSVGYSYNEYDYESRSYRTDNSVSFNLGVGMDVTSYGGIQLAYEFVNNASSYAERTFSENIVGLQVDFTY